MKRNLWSTMLVLMASNVAVAGDSVLLLCQKNIIQTLHVDRNQQAVLDNLRQKNQDIRDEILTTSWDSGEVLIQKSHGFSGETLNQLISLTQQTGKLKEILEQGDAAWFKYWIFKEPADYQMMLEAFESVESVVLNISHGQLFEGCAAGKFTDNLQQNQAALAQHIANRAQPAE